MSGRGIDAHTHEVQRGLRVRWRGAVAHMSIDQTQRTIECYFEAMGSGEDFSRFYSADVTWSMVDSGEKVTGPSAVRDYIVALQGRMFGDLKRDLVISDGHACVEGDCVDVPGGIGARHTYCLVYDVDNDRITAMRCYGSIARLMSRQVKATQRTG